MDVPSPSKPFWRRWFGSRSERAAAKFLKTKGLRIVARNFSCPMGELDIIALDGSVIVFVEVRSTEDGDDSGPAASVDFAKQRRLTQLALYFLKKKKLLEHPARFDVLTVSWPPNRKDPQIVHHVNAFEAVGKFQIYS